MGARGFAFDRNGGKTSKPIAYRRCANPDCGHSWYFHRLEPDDGCHAQKPYGSDHLCLCPDFELTSRQHAHKVEAKRERAETGRF